MLTAIGNEVANPGDAATARLLAMSWTLREVLGDVLVEWHPDTTAQIMLAMAARNILAESNGIDWRK